MFIESEKSFFSSKGGALLGTKRTMPSKNFQKCAENLEKNKIQGLVVVGGKVVLTDEY